MILDGKTVMVIGVGPGLGYSCATAAFRDGANVVIVARNEERLIAAAEALDPSGERVAAASADIMDQASLEAAVQVAIDKFGALDAVINVAALDTHHAPFADLDDDTLLKNLEVNVLGAVHVVRAVTPAFAERGGGSVVLIGNLAQQPEIAFSFGIEIEVEQDIDIGACFLTHDLQVFSQVPACLALDIAARFVGPAKSGGPALDPIFLIIMENVGL